MQEREIMNAKKILGLLLFFLVFLVIIGFIIRNPYYWTVVDMLVIIIGLVGGVILLRDK